MCRDVDINDHQDLIDRTGHDPEDAMTDIEYQDFLRILDGHDPESKVEIRHSSFSELEIDRLLKAVLPLVESN